MAKHESLKLVAKWLQFPVVAEQAYVNFYLNKLRVDLSRHRVSEVFECLANASSYGRSGFWLGKPLILKHGMELS